MRADEIGKYVQSASKLPGRPANAPKGLSQPQPMRRAVPAGQSSSQGEADQQYGTVVTPAPGVDQNEAAIAALQARVTQLETQLQALLSAVSVDPAGNVTISSGGRVEVQASNLSLAGALITLDSGVVNASSVVKCDTMIAEAVVAKSYTPGAGNIW